MSETIDAERRRKINFLAEEVCGMELKKHNSADESDWDWWHAAPTLRRAAFGATGGQGPYADLGDNRRFSWNPFDSHADIAFVQERIAAKDALPTGHERSLWGTYLRCLCEVLGAAPSLAQIMLATPAERAEAAFAAGTKLLGARPSEHCYTRHRCAQVQAMCPLFCPRQDCPELIPDPPKFEA